MAAHDRHDALENKMERTRYRVLIGLTLALLIASSVVTYGLTYLGGNNVEDEDIQKAVESIMSLRPKPKTQWESLERRIITK